MIDTLLLLAGLAFLIKGADLLVSGASSIAGRLGISSLVIGLTVVSFGTSAPELVVSTVAALGGNSDLAVGNVLGSNLANIGLILMLARISDVVTELLWTNTVSAFSPRRMLSG